MHILFLPIAYPNTYNHTSGVFFHEQAQALAVNGHKVGVLALVGIPFGSMFRTFKISLGLFRYADRVDVWRYQYLSIPKIGVINNLIRVHIGKRIFKNYLKQNGLPDIIHVHVSLAGSLAVWIKQKYNIPYVVTEHSSLFLGKDKMSWWRKMIVNRVYAGSSANVSVSEKLKNEMLIQYGVRSTVIPNAVDVNYFDIQKRPVEKNKGFAFLNIANFNSNKNQAMLIRAFKKAFEGDNSYKLIVAGGGSEKRSLQSLVNELNLSGQVTLLDMMSREEVKALMYASDCFVLSSYKETFGVVLVEAMSSGLPVISTKSGGPESIITEDKLGILCDVTVESIASAMKQVVTKKYDFAYIRAQAEKRFSYNAFVEQITPLYTMVINTKNV